MTCSPITGQPDGELSEAEEKGTRIRKDEKHFSSTVKLLLPAHQNTRKVYLQQWMVKNAQT